jgi:ectoine hydroxylase-related dioxygenase (phytanoyl-CoA dioxygenase family)
VSTTVSLDAHREELRRQGVTIVPEALNPSELEELRIGLEAALEVARAEGQVFYRAGVDPNESSVRVLQLLGRHPSFEGLVDHPVARGLVSALLGDAYLLSSLSANISLPGSESMGLHNDLMAVLPEPWLSPYGANLFICLDDMDEENGATRYVPESHRRTTSEQTGGLGLEATRPLVAPAGSIVAMDARLWHTSGANRSADRPRRVLISFYVAPFIRTQYNWAALLPAATQDGLTPALRALLGLDEGNMGVRLAYDAFSGTEQEADPLARRR